MARPREPHPLAMARLYVEQGWYERAAEIYAELLAVAPDDRDVRARLDEVEAVIARRDDDGAATRLPGAPSSPTRPLSAAPALDEEAALLVVVEPHSGEPFGMLDLEELPEGYGVDTCELLARDPFHVFAYWEVTDDGLARARHDLGADADGARLVLRVFVTAAGRPVSREARDHQLEQPRGRRYLPSPRPGVLLRAAVGLVATTGLFAPIAHSQTVRVPPAEPAPPLHTREWVEVPPAPPGAVELAPIRVLRSRATEQYHERSLPPYARLPDGDAGGAGESEIDPLTGRSRPRRPDGAASPSGGWPASPSGRRGG